MRNCLVGFLLFLFLPFDLAAQKPPIDSTTFEKWPRLGQYAIANNGKYMFYMVHDPVLNQDSLFVKSTDARWQKCFLNGKLPALTQDCRQVVFQRHDSIFMVGLGNDSIEHIDSIDGNYAILPMSKGDDLLTYKSKRQPNILITRLKKSGEIRSYQFVAKYWSNASSGSFFILTKDTSEPGSKYHLINASCNLVKMEDIWQGAKVENLVFNSDGTQFAFWTKNGQGRQSLWYHNLQKHKTVNLVSDSSTAIGENMKIASIIGISKANGKVFLSLIKSNNAKYVPPIGVDIYSYKDLKLQSQQLYQLEHPPFQSFLAVINVSNGNFLQIEQEGEEIRSLDLSSLPDNWILLIKHGAGDYENEWYWNKAALSSICLVSLNDGKRLLLDKEMPYKWPYYFHLSPDEKHVLYYDQRKLQYYSFDIATGVRRCITEGMSIDWTRKNLEVFPTDKPSPFGIGGFTSDGKAAFIYDQYDIYKVELSAKSYLQNITASYGRTHHIIFRLFKQKTLYEPHANLILNAFNDNNKEQGFYRIIPGRSKQPDSLSMLPMSLTEPTWGMNDSSFLIRIMGEKSASNIFFSNDFQSFTPLSNLHSEQKYNWLTSELVTWELPNGKKANGILYKPENFNPSTKYPIIFVYYESKSDQLHSFQSPQTSYGEINIPYFVSNGYLVFTPDIHYSIGFPGRSALNSIISAANILAKRPYVDATKMGLNGVSFGGFETNYVITHSTRFAAAVSNSGMTNFISAYGSIIGDGTSRQRQYEIYRDRMNSAPWQRTDLYIDNSPVFRAQYVHTPLLMVANNNDPDVPHQQGIEFFTALRRLGKKTWLLQYDGEGHGVLGAAAKDFTLRAFQFFNYYLKGLPPPKWMTSGIPAKLKGIDNGFQLDTSGATP